MPKKRSRLSPSVRSKVTRRTLLIMTAAVFFAIVSAILIILNLGSFNAYAAASGDFRSATSGDWSSTSTWERYNGSAWVAASATPTDADGSVTIQAGHTVTVTASVNVDQLTVDAGGAITINAGKTLSIKDGTGTDLIVNGSISAYGTLDNKGNTNCIINGTVTIQSGGQNSYAGGATCAINNGGKFIASDASIPTGNNVWTVNSGGIMQIDYNGYKIPYATWNSGSTCLVTGITNSEPTQLDQTFAHFTWNCPNQNSVLNFQGKLTDITGDFTFVSTGTGELRLGQQENYILNIGGSYYHQGGILHMVSKSLTATMNIAGNFLQTGGTFTGTDGNKDNGEGSPTINVAGNFTLSSGTFDFNQYTSNSSGKGITTLNLSGNFTQTGGTLTETATSTGRGEVYFKKAGTQYFSKTSGTASNTINYTINSGAIVDAGTSVFTSSGTFTLSSGGGLNMGSPDGITQSTAAGNVQVTGTRSYSTGADYTYNGTTAQVTGNGLPSTVRYLTINNVADVTLTNSVSASSMLYLTRGRVITNANELAVSNTSSSAISGHSATSYVIGNLRRSINSSGNYDYPVGSSMAYELLNLSLSGTAGFSSVLGSFVPGDPAPGGMPNGVVKNGKYFDKMLNMGYWTLDPNSALTSGTYGVTLYGLGFSNESAASSKDSTNYVTFKRHDSGNNWDVLGNADVSKQKVLNNKVITCNIGYTTFSHFGQGSGGSTLPIKLMSFDAKLKEGVVDLTWTTASEINNDYFTIQRSTNGVKFTDLFREKGAGNSSHTLYYAGRDEHPQSGYNYYRLKQTDYDGHFSYSDIKTVRVKTAATEATEMKIESVYPNPFSDNFTVNFTMKKNAVVEVVILNANGQVVAQDKVEAVDGINSYQYFNNKDLKNGIYFVALLYNDQKVIQKVIKN